MSREKLCPEDSELAIRAYATAIPLLNVIEFEISHALTAQATPSSFSQCRELWRWVERLLFRAITLLARTRYLDDQEGLIWDLFTHYESCSPHWPPTFRSSHRSIVAVLHLRALIFRFRAPSPPVTPTPSLQPDKPPQWLNTARSIINEYCTVLDRSTHFPRAGERNVKVENLVDLSVAVWEASGGIADRAEWVIDVGHHSVLLLAVFIFKQSSRYSGGLHDSPSTLTESFGICPDLRMSREKRNLQSGACTYISRS